MKTFISILAIVTTLSLASASVDMNLKYGMKNDQVSELQDFLTDKGFMSQTTGFFGVVTLKAVKAYQLSLGLPNTGFVGVLTRAEINKELTLVVASSTETEAAEPVVQVVQTTYTPQVNTGNAPNDSIPFVAPTPIVLPKPACTLTVATTTNNGGDIVVTYSWTSQGADSGFINGINLNDKYYVNGQITDNTVSKGTNSGFTIKQGANTFIGTFTGKGGSVSCESSL